MTGQDITAVLPVDLVEVEPDPAALVGAPPHCPDQDQEDEG